MFLTKIGLSLRTFDLNKAKFPCLTAERTIVLTSSKFKYEGSPDLVNIQTDPEIQAPAKELNKDRIKHLLELCRIPYQWQRWMVCKIWRLHDYKQRFFFLPLFWPEIFFTHYFKTTILFYKFFWTKKILKNGRNS